MDGKVRGHHTTYFRWQKLWMAGMYQVKDWQLHFENNKSRERDHCRFACMPNKQDGMGLLSILSDSSGLQIYAIWCLIVGACSRQRKPRNGYLSDDGTPKGRAWTATDLAVRWRCAAEQVVCALKLLSSDQVGWIELVAGTATTYDGTEQVPGECPPSAPEWNGMERKGIEPPTPKGVVVDEPVGFTRFWSEWPKHHRKVNRAGCLRSWNRSKLEPIAEQVIESLGRWKVSDDWTRGCIPLVATWLNQRRWEAEFAEPAEEESVYRKMTRELEDERVRNNANNGAAERTIPPGHKGPA